MADLTNEVDRRWWGASAVRAKRGSARFVASQLPLGRTCPPYAPPALRLGLGSGRVGGRVGAHGSPFVTVGLWGAPSMSAGREASAAAMWVVGRCLFGACVAASNVVRARKPLLPCAVPVFCRQTRIRGSRRAPLGVGIAPSLRNILNSLPFKERRWQNMCRRRFHGFHRTAFR